jgi:hypothetical protein
MDGEVIHTESLKDEKYIVFKRDEFIKAMTPYAFNYASAELKAEQMLDLAIPDAVVIRRQDKFASPALYTYANMISMVAMMDSDLVRQRELLDIADYFQTQAELAGDEAWKLPD